MNELPPWIARPLDVLLAPDGIRHHALLIHGPAGVGKSVLAHELAAARLCEAPRPTGLACGSCAACGWLAEGNHPDLRVLGLESGGGGGQEDEAGDEKSTRKSRQIPVDRVRDAIDFVLTTAHRKGTRVVLVDPADALNPASGNALLKILEEPPENVQFLLVTHEPRRLLPTLRSRCLRVSLPLPRRAEALRWIEEQCPGRAGELLDRAGGAPLEALELASEAGDAARDALVHALSEPIRDLPATARALIKSELEPAVNGFQRWVHDLMALRSGGKTRFFGDRHAVLESIAAKARMMELLELEGALRGARRDMGIPLRPELVVERLLILYARAVRL